MENIYFEKILPEAEKKLKREKMPVTQKVAENWKNLYFNELKSKRYSYNSIR